MDAFELFRGFESVKRVSNLFDKDLALRLNFVFYICPRVSGKGFRLNSAKTGLTVTYALGLSDSTMQRVRRVRAFLEEATKREVRYTITAIFAIADAWILFPLPVDPPVKPDLGVDIQVTSNLPDLNDWGLFADLYNERPWLTVPQKIRDQEEERIKSMLPNDIPGYIVDDFVRRVMAGFAMDGGMLRAGYFDTRPIILGVESPGVPVLQNACLVKDSWVPVIELH